MEEWKRTLAEGIWSSIMTYRMTNSRLRQIITRQERIEKRPLWRSMESYRGIYAAV